MEVRKGYKQTEVGVIPKDWNVRRIDDVCKLINGRGFKPFEWKETGLPIIRIQNLNGSDDFNFFTGIYDKKLEVETGQLLFAWSGSRGTSFGPHVWQGSLGLLNYHTWKIQIQEIVISKNFFLHALRFLTAFIEGKAHGAAALVHVQKWEMESFQFPIPPTLAEQEAIAEALSDADAFIEAVEQLLAKKRQVKQGAMSELLTGKRRLAGFGKNKYKQTEIGVIPEDWKVQSISDIGEVRGRVGWKGYTKKDLTLNGPYVIGAKHIDKYFKLDLSEPTYLSREKYMESPEIMVELNDLLIVQRGTLGKLTLIDSEIGEATINPSVVILRTKKVSPGFVYYFFLSEMAQSQILSDTSSTGVPMISQKQIENFKICLPVNISEQTAIAEILSDMDAEISALEGKLVKARQVKAGMMSELLTGKIRLNHD